MKKIEEAIVANVTNISEEEWTTNVLPLLTEVSSSRSLIKVGAFALLLTVVSVVLATTDSFWIFAVFVPLQGLIFAHGLELQHECLHDNMFKRKWGNYVSGVFVGVPMLVPLTHYKVQHLHHHRYLGTEHDKELFDYDAESLTSIAKFIKRAWNFDRIPHFFRTLVLCWTNRYPDVFRDEVSKRRVKWEYTFIALLLIGAVIVAAFGHWRPIMLWLLPLLIFAEPIHYLIELPEHIHCNKKSRLVADNSRSYATKKIWQYIINGNNYHAEHHLYPKVATHNLAIVNKRFNQRWRHTGESYVGVLKAILFERE